MTTYQTVREVGPIIDQIEFVIPEDILKAFPPKQYTPRKVSASGIKSCSREWWFKLSPATRTLGRERRKVEWDRAAAYGNVLHEQIQQALMDYDLVANPEAYLPANEHFTSGRIDGQLTSRRCLLEIKTVGDSAWSQLPDHSKFEGYQDQIQLYLEELDLPQALLVCVRRDTAVAKPRPEDRRKLRSSLVKEFLVERDPERGQELIQKALAIRDALATQTVPAADNTDSCFFCSMQHLCAIADMDAELAQEASSDV